jgi:hypothetical protein
MPGVEYFYWSFAAAHPADVLLPDALFSHLKCAVTRLLAVTLVNWSLAE